MTKTPPRDPIPERFGAYRVLELLGTGGMGRVYRAVDEALQREVALKTLLPALAADAEFVARFTREARAAASLNHPNITQVYATGDEGSIPYFAMELIRGRSLEAVARQGGSIEPFVAAGYIMQAAAGLRHAAQKGLIHRDIKPSNLMLTEDGEVKVTDFGLAKAARGDSQLTATGEVLGSPGYISPEQAQGQTLDARSDIYSLGATFFHLITGRLPFQAPTAVAMILKHMNEPLRSPRALNAAIPFPIAAIIQKMMAKNPAERFQDYDSLLRELERATCDTRVASVEEPDPAARTRRRSPLAAPMAPRPDRPPTPRERAAREIAAEARPATSLPLLPAGLMIVAIALVGAAVWRHVSDATDESGAPAAAPSAAAMTPTMSGEGSFTEKSALSAPAGRPAGAGGALRDGRADLIFLTNDHDSLPGGGLRVSGRVQNRGNAQARQARVRVKVVLDNGQVAAQGDTDLRPQTLLPGQSAAFDLTLDYSGPAGTIRAEIIWTD
ncbi:MAG TPA: serine/threonine-protein kinase [Patescibacteria group bacterium]|nr:serine/threonine-protein kinase [Patescibacteria group bacterium]